VATAGDVGVIGPATLQQLPTGRASESLYAPHKHRRFYKAPDPVIPSGWHAPQPSADCQLLMVPHRPEVQEEVARVVRCGGGMYAGRVNGKLAITRAVGDRDLKSPMRRDAGPLAFQPRDEIVTAEPSVTAFALTRDADFLVLASDGLLDFCPQEHIASVVRARRAEGWTPQRVAHYLAQEVLSPPPLSPVATSPDNVTCVVVYIEWPQA